VETGNVARPRSSRDRSPAAGSTLTLAMRDGTKVVVPRSLEVISTYVLLEQERWFEKEVDFVTAFLQPGMSVVDVGANVGVYALSMARKVGPSGRVYAFEPTGETRSLLAAGVKANGLANVTVSPAALSDHTGQAVLGHGTSSELNALTSEGSGETVAVTTLDEEDATGRWLHIDFVKLDAEGAEEKIIAGGLDFLKRHAPIVMFEVKAGAEINAGLAAAFRAQDFAVFRSLPEVALLVPTGSARGPADELDAFELNLFAVPSSRVDELAAASFLVSAQLPWHPMPDDVAYARQRIAETAFYSAFQRSWPDIADLPERYRAGLAGFAAWRFGARDWSCRYAALMHAVTALEEHAAGDANCATLSMLARAQLEAGLRGKAVATLRKLAERMVGGGTAAPVPFWPALARLDSVAPGAQPAIWLMVGGLEQLEKAARFSTVFGRGPTVDLAFLADQVFAHIEMERRRVLVHARQGATVDITRRLWPITPDHRNGEIWRHGLVPNTRRHPTR
jgi:FkbM family methyltransferase